LLEKRLERFQKKPTIIIITESGHKLN